MPQPKLMKQRKPKTLPPTFVPLNQLGAYLTSTPTEEVLRRAQALYEAEPTRAHHDNLVEAKYEHALATGKRTGRRK